MRNIHVNFFVLVCILFVASCQSTDSKNLRLQLFEQTWSRVNDHYFDADFHGHDWNAIKKQYKPLIENVQSGDEFFIVLNKMLFELGSSHLGVGPISEIEKVGSPYMFKEGSIGIDIRFIKGEVVITRIETGSPADEKGLKIGDVINQVDGSSIDSLLTNCRFHPPFNKVNRRMSMTEEVLRKIYGQTDTEVTIEVEDVENNVVKYRMKRVRRSPPLQPGLLPEIYLEVEEKIIAPDIAYVRFNSFQPVFPEKILNSFEKVKNSKGLIIDLRGNNGGSVEAMQMIISRFTPERFKAFTIEGRGDPEHFYVDPGDEIYRGEVIVLVDGLSVSGAENMAIILQMQKLAIIVGVKTSGQLLWGEGSMISEDVILVIPTNKIVYPNGFNPEGVGVTPDIIVELSKEDLKKGIDSQLEAAIRIANIGIDKRQH